jgi:hypothetical protein
MKVFAYADETEFLLKSANSSIIGSAILITEKEIDESVIASAINNLKAEQSLDKNDLRTIKNDFFHASSDSKNAHWYLCDAINNNINGLFKYSYHNQSLAKKVTTIESLNKRTLELAAIPLIDYKFEEITLYIEGRSKFDQKKSEAWIENLYRILEVTLHNQTSMITYFPKINIIVDDKRNPGLQVVDFVLWAHNRTLNGDFRWLNSLKAVRRDNHRIENSPSSGGSFYLNEMIEFPLERLNYPFTIPQESNHNEVIRSYVIMEQTILILSQHIDKLPITIDHFKQVLKSLAKKLIKANKSLSVQLIQEVASVYLRLFDTLPIYSNLKDEDKGGWDVLLFSKYIAALIRRTGFINSGRTIDHIAYWKYHTDEADYLPGVLPITAFLKETVGTLVPG